MTIYLCYLRNGLFYNLEIIKPIGYDGGSKKKLRIFGTHSKNNYDFLNL